MTKEARFMAASAARSSGEQTSEQNAKTTAQNPHNRKFENGVNRVNIIYGNIFGIVKYIERQAYSLACLSKGVLFTTSVHSLSNTLRVRRNHVHSVHSAPLGGWA